MVKFRLRVFESSSLPSWLTTELKKSASLRHEYTWLTIKATGNIVGLSYSTWRHVLEENVLSDQAKLKITLSYHNKSLIYSPVKGTDIRGYNKDLRWITGGPEKHRCFRHWESRCVRCINSGRDNTVLELRETWHFYITPTRKRFARTSYIKEQNFEIRCGKRR